MIEIRFPYSEHIDEIINDMCYTLSKNKDLIKDISKDFTRAINISFTIIPDEILTMDIYCSELVQSEEMQLEKEIELIEENNGTN